MEKMPLISVIVPVYKVEAYLDKCISSIVSQTYENLEIILVDDGSPDRSGAICDAWAAKDSRIRVIHQENAGGGAARNAALDIARGELFAFVDSDDYIAPDMFAHLSELLEEGADIAECGWCAVYDDGAVFAQDMVSWQSFSAEEAMERHIRGTGFRQLIWNKLYRRETVEHVRFPVGTKIDDEFFTWQVLANAKVLVSSDRVCYAYRQQESSVMHSLNAERRLEGVTAKVQRQSCLREKFPQLESLGLQDIWYTCLYQGQRALRELEEHEAERILARLEGVLREHPADLGDYGAKEKIWFSLARKSLKTACRVRNLLKIGL